MPSILLKTGKSVLFINFCYYFLLRSTKAFVELCYHAHPQVFLKINDEPSHLFIIRLQITEHISLARLQGYLLEEQKQDV